MPDHATTTTASAPPVDPPAVRAVAAPAGPLPASAVASSALPPPAADNLADGLAPAEVERLALSLFALLFAAAAVLPARPSWVHVWAEWRVTEVVLALFGLALLAVRPWRRRVLRARNASVLLAVGGLAAGWWAAPRSAMVDATFVHLALCLVTGFFTGRVVAARRSGWRPLAVFIAGVAGLVALAGLLEVASGRNPLYEGTDTNPYHALYREERRAISTQFNPAPLGSFLVLALPFAGWLAGRREPRWHLAALGGVAVIAATTLLTYSRGALAGLAAAAALSLLFAGRRRALLVLASLLVTTLAVASTLPYPLNKLSLPGLLERGGVTSEQRLSRIETTAAILAEHPLLGLGFHQARRQFEHYFPPTRPAWARGEPVLDNAYLTVLAETGLVGAGALATFLLLELGRGLRAWRRHREPFVAAALAGVLGLLVTAVGYDLVYWSGPVLSFALVLGVLSGAAQAPASGREHPLEHGGEVAQVEPRQDDVRRAVEGAQAAG
jgi:hypothetical protein